MYQIGLTDEKPTQQLNATPTALPDIDYDTNARDQIKEYLVYKFGREQVTLMGTFGTLKTKVQ
jgi:DNA polymerase III alpha subunit